MSIDEQIEVLKACKEGKTIQMRDRNSKGDWFRKPSLKGGFPSFNFAHYDYRIKPEEKNQHEFPNWFEYDGKTYAVRDLDFVNDTDGDTFICIKGVQRIRMDEECESKDCETSERMTNRQLAEWLAKGNGDWNMTDSNYPSISYVFNSDEEDEPVDEKARVRRFGSDEWIVPTKEIYDRDCAEKGFSDFFYNLISDYNGCNHDDDDDEDEGKKPLILGDTDLASRYIGKTGWFADSLEVLKRGKEKNPRLRYHGVLKDVRGFLFNMVSDRKYEGEYVPFAFFMPDEVLK